MQIEKRIILVLITVTLVITGVVYWSSRKAYVNAPKDGSPINVQQTQSIPTSDANPPDTTGNNLHQ